MPTLVRCANGEREAEGAAFTGITLDAEPATMQRHELTTDGQAETNPADTAAHRIFELLERLENARYVFGGDTDSGVDDSELDVVCTRAHLKCDFALGREADRVAEQ